MKQVGLTYHPDSSLLASCVAHEPWFIFLDSSYPHINLGRYDIIAARPYTTLVTYDQSTDINNHGQQYQSTEDPFTILKEHLGSPLKPLSSIPFCGGALGYFSYDLGFSIEPSLIKQPKTNDIPMPDMAIGIYDWIILVDHHLRRTVLISLCQDPNTEKQWHDILTLFAQPPTPKPINTSPLKAEMSMANYSQAFNQIKTYLHDGDCYQVNLSQRFSTEFNDDPWDLYLQLRNINPAPYAGFMRLPQGAILSSSPEQFLHVSGQRVQTKPIKGTRPRSMFAYEDKILAETLLNSEKDRAENLMIVDLLRNDIGKCCKIGSIEVSRLFAVESYASIHHLVSTIIGQLNEQQHVIDLLRATFPGGSITGAPKLRTMQIIEELEPCHRSVYCGVMGYIGFDGNMNSNICIRTLIYAGNTIYCYAGGGIVWDSELEKEYQECQDKITPIINLFSHDLIIPDD